MVALKINSAVDDIYRKQENDDIHWIKLYSTGIIRIILSVIAIYLSWDCNKNSGIFMKIILAIVAFLFSEIYILYYAVYRVFMGNSCY
tara:strand:- start:2328 stop:2591 length:264 start_codon:yes stop_codon:yes gene_type:complete